MAGFPQEACRFSIAQLPAQTSVFPNPSSLCSVFPHSFGYFKLVLRSRSFTLAPNLTGFPSVTVETCVSVLLQDISDKSDQGGYVPGFFLARSGNITFTESHLPRHTLHCDRKTQSESIFMDYTNEVKRVN